MQRHWKPVYVKKHQKCPDLDNLVTGVIPAIILENALSEITCKEVSKKITEFHNMTNFSPNSRYVGESLNSYINFKTQYFEKTKHMDHQLRQVFSDIEDPRYIMRDLLSTIFTKKIIPAKENGKTYSNGIFRIHNCDESFPIHRDNASFEANNYTVSKLRNQLSAVLHLQTAQSGGELILYQKSWKKSDEQFRFPEFGYSDDVVNDSKFIKIKPNVGDIVIINPIHYHTISKINGVLDRISVGFFFGQSDKSTLLCWS